MMEKYISLWDRSAEESDYDGGLETTRTADVIVVGGGFTGLSTAFHGATLGLDIHVLEANKIGYGGSGRNTGLVNAGLWLPPQDVEKHLGPMNGANLIETLGKMPEYVFSLIEKHQIQCEATQNGTIHAAHSPAGLKNLEGRAKEWERLGAPVQLLTAKETEDKTGTKNFYGGLLDNRAGTINPMGYVRGLARIALAAGARLSTGIKVEKISRSNDQWNVHCGAQVLSAKNVILATNAYTDNLWPGLKQTFTKINYFNIATSPIDEKKHSILSEGHGLWDTGKIMFSLRKDIHGRLIIGSMGSIIKGMENLSERWAIRNLRRLYPDLSDITIESAWHGNIAMTPDHLFRIHKLAENLYTPIGYNGRGITTGTMFGKVFAELLTGKNEANLPVPITKPYPVNGRLLKQEFLRLAFTVNQFVKAL
ncbi:MAG: FAD-binding oxidoreductase [Nisaea sp.]|nr:FAD-binding oxidoreductase [Nisaea sp.]